MSPLLSILPTTLPLILTSPLDSTLPTTEPFLRISPFDSILPLTLPFTSLEPTSNTLGKVLHRPALFPLPTPILYAVVGEAALIIASGQRAHPTATLKSGYTFKYPEIEGALKASL